MIDLPLFIQERVDSRQEPLDVDPVHFFADGYVGREQALDVKLRSSQVRAARTRMTAISLGAVFATVFGLYLLYRAGDLTLNRLVYENKAFAIKEIDVQTDGVISVDQLRRWA